MQSVWISGDPCDVPSIDSRVYEEFAYQYRENAFVEEHCE